MERNAYFDNAKLLLIFTVVFGHMIQPYTVDSKGINTIYLWMYTFNMPAFIFLAGFFAKGSENMRYIINLAKKILFPYIIFQLLYTGFYFFIGKDDWQTSLFYPHWSLWFLLSLFSWHILLQWFKKLPVKISLFTAVLIGLMIGYIDNIGHLFSLSRTFVFFPFFLLGYWLTKDQVMVLKRESLKIISIIIIALVALIIYEVPEFNVGWLLASKSYDTLGVPTFGGLVRMLVYFISTLMAVSVLAWVPVREYRMTKLGARTLYVYLLHGFFIQFLREVDLFVVSNVLDVFGLAVLSAIIVWLLSSKPVLGLWQPFIEGRAKIIKNVLRDN